MHFSEIKKHLKPYSIFQKRRTTVNHAFAASIATCDDYDQEKVIGVIRAFGQDPALDLRCVYCDGAAQTWDHVLPTVIKSEFSGAGHQIANLLPCCKPCNSSKGSRNWEVFLKTVSGTDEEFVKKRDMIRSHVAGIANENLPNGDQRYNELRQIRDAVLLLLKKADVIAKDIRTNKTSNSSD